jgi:hypothetical protein
MNIDIVKEVNFVAETDEWKILLDLIFDAKNIKYEAYNDTY